MALITRTSQKASEGDAYRYTKKVLHELYGEGTSGNPFIVEDRLDDADRIAAEPQHTQTVHILTNQERLDAIANGETFEPITVTEVHDRPSPPPVHRLSWERSAFNRIRGIFFHDGISDVYFAPGVVRIACTELGFPGNTDGNKLLRLASYIQMISMGHRSEYTRKLVSIETGEPLTFELLDQMFGEQLEQNFQELCERLRQIDYGEQRYRIIWLRDPSVAASFSKFTVYGDRNIGWCHLNSASVFRSYERGGSVRLYLAVLPGFEKLTPEDPEFGESMLGIDIGPGGRLVHVNNRWNHAHDGVDIRKGDNKYSAEELSVLLGAPYYELCPPYSEENYLATFGDADDFIKNTCVPVRNSRTIYTDPRDGEKYHVVRIGNLELMCDPMRYGNGMDLSRVASRNWGITQPTTDEIDLGLVTDEDMETRKIGVMYDRFNVIDAVPPGWRIPTHRDMNVLAANGFFGKPGAVDVHSKVVYAYDRTLHDLVKYDTNRLMPICGINMTNQGRIARFQREKLDRIARTGYNPFDTMALHANGMIGMLDEVRGLFVDAARERFKSLTLDDTDQDSVLMWVLQGTHTFTWYRLDECDTAADGGDINKLWDAYATEEDWAALDTMVGVECEINEEFEETYRKKIKECMLTYLLKFRGLYAGELFSVGGGVGNIVGCTLYCVRDAQ